MNLSVFDLFKIGIGPSSSHTVGPMFAAKQFLVNCIEKFPLEKISSLNVELFGSLAFTGKGHGTDRAIIMGLEGNEPASINTEQIPVRLEQIKKYKSLSLMNQHSIPFEEKDSLIFNHDDCLPHPAWIEPIEWLGNRNNTHPFHLICNQPETKLHSQLDHGNYSKSRKINGREPVLINKYDAIKKNINDNDLVIVFNGRGACIAGALITDKVMQGVLIMSTGSWYDPIKNIEGEIICNNGNPNILTIDKGTSKLAQGPIAHSCLVNIEKCTEKLPKVTAYDKPKIINYN